MLHTKNKTQNSLPNKLSSVMLHTKNKTQNTLPDDLSSVIKSLRQTTTMPFKPTATLEPSTIHLFEIPGALVSRVRGWITIRCINPKIGDITETVPEAIESVETMQYLGLTPAAAMEALYEFVRQYKLTEYVKIEFVEWAKKHVEKFPDCDGNDAVSKWDDAMKVMGVQELRRKAILDPEFATLREEHTAKYWVMQMMEEKWKHLVELNQKLKSDMLKSRQ